MLVALRFAAVLLLVAAAGCYGFYLLSGQTVWRRRGTWLMLAFIIGASVFFGILIAQRLL